MNWMKVFLAVTACALGGMLLGGLFGWGAGTIAPDVFRRVIPWQDAEPVGTATFLGATAGVLCGGALGCFGILAQIAICWRSGRKSAGDQTPQ